MANGRHARAHAVVDVQKVREDAHPFGRAVKLVYFFNAEPLLEGHPDIRPKPVAANVFQRRLMIVGLRGRRHQIAADFSHVNEVRRLKLPDVVQKFAGAEFSAQGHRRAVIERRRPSDGDGVGVEKGKRNVNRIRGLHGHDKFPEPEHGRKSPFVDDDRRLGQAPGCSGCVDICRGVFQGDAFRGGGVCAALTRQLARNVRDVFCLELSRVPDHSKRRLGKIYSGARLDEKLAAFLADQDNFAPVEIEAVHQRVSTLIGVDQRGDGADF